MTATAESVPAKVFGFRSSSLKRPLQLQSTCCRLHIDPEGAVRALESLEEKRALFGLEQLWFFKVQAGIVVHAQRPDWIVRMNPRQVRLSGKIFDAEVTQSIEFLPGQAAGFLRRVSIKNAGQGLLRLRIVELLDPTAAHFDSSGRWGALGVNAFNRESHVAMDEVSDPPSARVAGASPSPLRFFMTTSRLRAQEVISSGELPEATAGMSGQVLILSVHELELAPGESRELTFASIYNPGKLEEALSDFGHLQSGEKQKSSPGPEISCSEQPITEAAAWAVAGVRAGAYSEDLLDRYETLRAVAHFDPELASRIIAEAKGGLRRDGSLPHALDHSGSGVLETAVFLRAAAFYLMLSQDKKLGRASYPTIKKLAGFLMASSKESLVQTDPSLPQGWRRRLGRGYPTGEIPEVSLAVAGALEGASQVARLVSKADDSGRFLERSKLITEHVGKKLLDERGFLSLCRDSAGRLRNDETADMVVAAYRHPFLDTAEQAAAHRLLEKDFDTPYGPRCVPISNLVYFNSAYGDGQLGGVWTRASLAHAIVCYRGGLSGMGGLLMAKVARLIADDALKLGGSPGGFPRWVDADNREAHDGESDPVAAARFLEVLLEGELGMPEGAEKAVLSPPQSSTLGWMLASDFWAGEQATVFLGRGAGKPHVFFSGNKLDSAGMRFAKWERVEATPRGVRGVSFHSPGQVICLGNTLPSQARFAVSFSPRAAEFTKRLSSPLEEYDPAKGTWNKTGSLRVSPTMTFEASLEPNGWKAYRVSTP
jgi:hypothetical protein